MKCIKILQMEVIFAINCFSVGENDGGTNKLFTNINGFQKFKEFFSNFLIILHTYTKKT